jgi:hypothetical protein
MKSWRTTMYGLIGSAAALILTLSGAGIAMPKWLTVTAGFLMAGGLAGVGTNAKDAQSHSTLPEVFAATAEAAAANPLPPPSKVIEIVK